MPSWKAFLNSKGSAQKCSLRAAAFIRSLCPSLWPHPQVHCQITPSPGLPVHPTTWHGCLARDVLQHFRDRQMSPWESGTVSHPSPWAHTSGCWQVMLVLWGAQACERQHQSKQNFEGVGLRDGQLLSAVRWGQKEHNTFPQKSNWWCSELKRLSREARRGVVPTALQLPFFLCFWCVWSFHEGSFICSGWEAWEIRQGWKLGKWGSSPSLTTNSLRDSRKKHLVLGAEMKCWKRWLQRQLSGSTIHNSGVCGADH